MERKILPGFLRKSYLFSFGLLILMAFASCQKEEEKIAPQQTNLEPMLQYLESTGFDRKDIVYENGLFIIEDDILITKEEVEKYIAQNGISEPNQRTEHYRGYKVSNTYVRNIKYYIEPSVSSSWKTAIRNSIKQWNAITSTKLYLSEVTTRSTANCIVNTGYENANWIARAYLPSYTGKPGFQMTINTKYNTLDSSRKLFTMVHEMGHTFGFYHTNQTQGIFITGSPVTDANSVMNSYVLPWNGFTTGDVKATRLIYPL
ncbi:MAG TPA: M57 family metalloprotease [Cytophagales bacterium]|nr:M57 family metalloprotease [Cytophagales bacterium]